MEVAEPASGLEDYADGNNWPFNFTEFFNSLLNFNHFIMVFYFCLFLVLVFSNHYVNWIYHKKNYTWWYFGQTRGQKSPKFWRELWPRPGAKGALAHFLNFNSFDVDVVVGTGRFFFFLFLPFLSWMILVKTVHTPESYTQEAWPLPRSQSVQSAFGTWARHLVSYRSTNQNKRSERFFYGNHATSMTFLWEFVVQSIMYTKKGV